MDSAEVTEIKRHFGVVAEGLRAEIRQVAEAVSSIDERLVREIQTLRTEMAASLQEIYGR
jgi:hypothetical protein